MCLEKVEPLVADTGSTRNMNCDSIHINKRYSQLKQLGTEQHRAASVKFVPLKKNCSLESLKWVACFFPLGCGLFNRIASNLRACCTVLRIYRTCRNQGIRPICTQFRLIENFSAPVGPWNTKIICGRYGAVDDEGCIRKMDTVPSMRTSRLSCGVRLIRALLQH